MTDGFHRFLFISIMKNKFQWSIICSNYFYKINHICKKLISFTGKLSCLFRAKVKFLQLKTSNFTF